MTPVFAKASHRNMYAVTGVLMMGLGLFALVTGAGSPIFLGVGILQLVISSQMGKNPLIVIDDDHLNIKLAPLASRHLVRFDDIDRVDDRGSKILIEAHGKTIKIPTGNLSEVGCMELREALAPYEG